MKEKQNSFGFNVESRLHADDPPIFDGAFVSKSDEPRLKDQISCVRDVLENNLNSWLTVDEIHATTFYPHVSISSQLRNLRKEKHGGYDVVGRYRDGTRIFEYQLNK